MPPLETFPLVLVGPGAAVIFGGLTLLITQWRAARAEVRTEIRAQQTEDRAAAKETVEILATQNRALLLDLAELRERVTHIERERKALAMELKASEKQRTTLLAEVSRLSAQLSQATKDIRSDVATNAELSRTVIDTLSGGNGGNGGKSA